MTKKSFLCAVSGLALFLFVSSANINVCAQEEKFGGLGLSVAQIYNQDGESNRGDLVVLDVIDETPAFNEGIHIGDVITHIDGEPVEGKEFEYLILEKLRGVVGSSIEIRIQRARVKEPLNFILTREEIVYSPEGR